MIELEFQNVTLAYGSHSVLENMSFTVRPGDLVGLIGPNGSGKSTIIKALSHIITPLSGTVRVYGRDIRSIPRRELACRVGVVPQLPLLPSTFSAFEIVLMGRNPHLGLLQSESARDREICWYSMERTETTHLAHRYVNELSGGEIQSLLLARVLAQETDSILLDEPTANLDIGRQIDTLRLIKGLCCEKNLTVMAAVHDLNLAAQYCNRLLLISEKHIYAEGTPSEVITNETIRDVYGADNCVYAHPTNGLPIVLAGEEHDRS